MANGNLRTTISDNDWKSPSEPTDTIVAGIQLVREVTEIDATAEAALMGAINGSTTVTDPLCDQVKYTGTYVVSDAVSFTVENAPYAGSVTIREKLTKVWTITNEASLPTKIRMYGKDIINAFALKSDTQNFVADQYLYCNPASESTMDAMSLTAPSGFTEVKRRVDVQEKGDRTATLNVLWRKTTQTAWGGAADLDEYDNYGYYSDTSKGEKTVHTRTWFGIQKSDLPTALTALYKGTSPATATSGYIIMDVTVRDQQDGGLTFSQREIQQVNNKDCDSRDLPDALGPQAITLDYTNTIYDDFTAAGLTAAVAGESTPATYTAAGFDTLLKENGLYRRVYRYLKGTYPNALAAGIPTYSKFMGSTGKGSDKAYGYRQEYQYYGLDASTVQTAVTTLEDPVGAEVGVYAVERVDASKGANGEATIQRVRRSINTDLTATGAVVQAIGWNENGEATEYARVWLGVSQGGANTLIGTAPFSAAGIASSDFTIDGVDFDHVRVSRESDPQTGNVNVVQIGRSTADDTWKKIWSYPQEELADFHKEVVQVNALNYEYTEGRKVTTSRSSALTWANGSNACPVGWRGCVIAQKCGSVRELPGGILYVATKITWGSGTNGNVDLT